MCQWPSRYLGGEAEAGGKVGEEDQKQAKFWRRWEESAYREEMEDRRLFASQSICDSILVAEVPTARPFPRCIRRHFLVF